MLLHSSPPVHILVLLVCASVTVGKIPNRSLAYSKYLDKTICRTLPGLTRDQMELCNEQPDTTLAAMRGLQQAVYECQHQFQSDRWNCSSLETKGNYPYSSVIFHKGFRETAFSYAISAAGVVISVARGCSQGLLMNCGCDARKYKTNDNKFINQPSTNWKWYGCSHNIHYGAKFAKIFLDRRETVNDIHSNVVLHNNRVGRMAVTSNIQIKCKCHGMSGSCELKTCWRTTPEFRMIGKMLKEKFRSAILVDQLNFGNRPLRKFNIVGEDVFRKSKKNKRRLIPRMKYSLSRNLIFYQKSPNYCDQDVSIDVPGTTGRYCNITKTGPENCATLCCGRGYNLLRRIRTEGCNCKFEWCCRVECQNCTTEEWISVCK